jgi:hypothetical protein
VFITTFCQCKVSSSVLVISDFDKVWDEAGWSKVLSALLVVHKKEKYVRIKICKPRLKLGISRIQPGIYILKIK